MNFLIRLQSLACWKYFLSTVAFSFNCGCLHGLGFSTFPTRNIFCVGFEKIEMLLNVGQVRLLILPNLDSYMQLLEPEMILEKQKNELKRQEAWRVYGALLVSSYFNLNFVVMCMGLLSN